MNITLHLTNNCNMRCSYCYIPKNQIKTMNKETGFASVDLAVNNTPENKPVGVIFYGGEPLLHKDLIRDIILYCEKTYPGRIFHYKLTTNALLLDKEFLDFSKMHGIFIAISLDGVKEAHDLNRKDVIGIGTHDRVIEGVKSILETFPYTPVMMTINPNTIPFYRDSIEYIYSLGCSYIICTLNYSADWTDSDLKELRHQYEELSKLYYEMTMKEAKFYFSPFDVKIASYINNIRYCDELCELGKKLIAITPEGEIYPCTQFVDDSEYLIGHVNSGINYERRDKLTFQNSEEKYECNGCKIKNRCNHSCGCINKTTTGFVDRVSPLQCEHERMLFPIADRLAEKLYKKRSAIFIHKHYNEMYPILSIIEDKKISQGTDHV